MSHSHDMESLEQQIDMIRQRSQQLRATCAHGSAVRPSTVADALDALLNVVEQQQRRLHQLEARDT